MRGPDTLTESLFTIKRLDDFVPADHPLRSLRTMANQALANMDGLFAQMYEADIKGGRPSIAPCAPCCCKCSIACAQSGN